MLLKWLDWLLGYVTIEVVGENAERFMNLCAAYKKDVWGFLKTENGVKANVRLSEMKTLRTISRKARVRIRILRRHGFWFLTKPIRKRWGLIIGMVVFCVLLWFLSGRIWYINIHGNTEIPTPQIMEMLQEAGVTQGVSSKAFDWATLRQSIITKHPQISWMSFNPQGCLLQVDISEAKAAPELPNQQEPCNIVASRDGRIVDIQVFTGNAAVKVGDAVVKGDMLINGAVEYSNGCTVFRPASGIVMAETVHKKSVFIPYHQKIDKPTGEKIQRKAFYCFGLDIPLFLGRVAPPYTKETKESYLCVKDISLPIGVKTATFFPTISEKIQINEEQAKGKGKEVIEQEIQKNFNEKQVKKVDYSYKVLSDGVETKSEIFCVENIIFREKLLIF